VTDEKTHAPAIRLHNNCQSRPPITYS